VAFAERHHIKHEVVDMTSSDFWSSLYGFSKIVEEPRVGQSVINKHLAMAIGDSFRVSLTGVGADEYFGGYPWRYPIDVDTQKGMIDLLDFSTVNEFVNWHRTKILRHDARSLRRVLRDETVFQSLKARALDSHHHALKTVYP